MEPPPPLSSGGQGHTPTQSTAKSPSLSQGPVQSSQVRTRLSVDSIPELGLLNSVRLNACEAFKVMKSSIECFYLDPEKCLKQHPGKSRQWMNVFYSELLRSLHSLTYESDPETQQSQLASMFQWFVKRTGLSRPVTAVTARDFFITRVRASTPSKPSHEPHPKHIQELSVSVDSHRSCPQTRKQSMEDERISRRMKEACERQLTQHRTARSNSRLIAHWRRAKSRVEEKNLAKYERSAQPRAPSEPRTAHTPTTAAECESSLLQQPETVVCYVQPEPSDASFEEYDPEEHSSAILSRIQRLRVAHRNVYQDVCSTGYYHRNLPSLSAYHPRTLRRPTITVKSRMDEAEEREEREKYKVVEEVRRKLVHEKVPCSYRAIQLGLKRPPGLSPWHGTKLPEGGEYLTSNPFFPVKKSGKGKTKRSK